MKKRITLIAAMDRGHVIGKNGDIPWRGKIPADMDRFKELTLGKTVIMGRKTWESLRPKFRPLPKRLNIVVTRDKHFRADGASVAHSVDETIALAGDAREICVIGGGEIYALFLPLATRLELTIVDTKVEGDTRFPALDLKEWKIIESEVHPKDEHNHFGIMFETYVR